MEGETATDDLHVRIVEAQRLSATVSRRKSTMVRPRR
jgi:hypothetical protein